MIEVVESIPVRFRSFPSLLKSYFASDEMRTSLYHAMHGQVPLLSA